MEGGFAEPATTFETKRAQPSTTTISMTGVAAGEESALVIRQAKRAASSSAVPSASQVPGKMPTGEPSAAPASHVYEEVICEGDSVTLNGDDEMEKNNSHVYVKITSKDRATVINGNFVSGGIHQYRSVTNLDNSLTVNGNVGRNSTIPAIRIHLCGEA